MTKLDQETLETMIDKTNIHKVIEGLIDICDDKAEHIRTNWQDENQAKEWERVAKSLLRVMDASQFLNY